MFLMVNSNYSVKQMIFNGERGVLFEVRTEFLNVI
jgi:hypothetical protein